MESGWGPSLDRAGCLRTSTSFLVLQGGWAALRCLGLEIGGQAPRSPEPSFLADTAGAPGFDVDMSDISLKLC